MMVTCTVCIETNDKMLPNLVSQLDAFSKWIDFAAIWRNLRTIPYMYRKCQLSLSDLLKKRTVYCATVTEIHMKFEMILYS